MAVISRVPKGVFGKHEVLLQADMACPEGMLFALSCGQEQVFILPAPEALVPGMWLLPDELLCIEQAVRACAMDPVLLAVDADGVVHAQENLTFAASFFKDRLDLSAIDALPGWHEAPYPRPEKLAVFTSAFNEGIFLDIFIRHYSKLVAPGHLYVLDHGSTHISSCLAGLYENPQQNKPKVVRIPRGKIDVLNHIRFVEHFQRFLLQQYEWVIYADCDELLIHRGGPQGLHALLDQTGNAKRIFKCAQGFDVVQDIDQESELDAALPVSRQRHWVKPNTWYAKPLLASMPVSWSPGFHKCLNQHEPAHQVCDDLFLLHLKSASLAEEQRRNAAWSGDCTAAHAEVGKRFKNAAGLLAGGAASPEESFRAAFKDCQPLPEWMDGLF
jgi:hypothetical protein